MDKSFIPVECHKNCQYSGSCCQVPTEVILHPGRVGIDLMIFGMGAGKDEEKQRRCFVGRSGKYMRQIIKALWDDSSVGPFNLAISNNVRFHPMDERGKDRELTELEISRCIEFLNKDICNLMSKAIVPVGKNATLTYLDPSYRDLSMGSLRGKSFELELERKTFKLYPTYHPSYLCRLYGSYSKEKNNEFDKLFIYDILTALDKR